MRRNLYLFCLTSAGLISVSFGTSAATCEDQFQAVGDARNGVVYTSSVTKPGLSVPSALGQLRKLGADTELTAGTETITGGFGELSLVWEKGKPKIVFKATADSAGTVTLATKLPPSQKMTRQEGIANICGILNALKAGEEGEAIAAAARSEAAPAGIINANAQKLSAEIGREIRQSMAAVNSKGKLGNALFGTSNFAGGGERNAAFAPIQAKYLGRKYRIDGKVYTTSFNQLNDQLTVAYVVTQPRGFLRMPQSLDSNNFNFTIECIFARDQVEFFATLSEGDNVTLTGTVAQIDPQGMDLKDCRQAK